MGSCLRISLQVSEQQGAYNSCAIRHTNTPLNLAYTLDMNIGRGIELMNRRAFMIGLVATAVTGRIAGSNRAEAAPEGSGGGGSGKVKRWRRACRYKINRFIGANGQVRFYRVRVCRRIYY